MQNLPVTASPPVISTQPPVPADNTAQATEPFGDVLARQRAGASPDKPADASSGSKPASNKPADASSASKPAGASSDSKPTDGKQGASSKVNDESSATASTKDAAAGQQAPVPDASNVVPADMLAMLLPATAATDKSVANDKPDPRAPSPDGVSTLPGDMLAMLLPAAGAKGTAASTAKDAAAIDAARGAARGAVAAKGIVTNNARDIQAGVPGDAKAARLQQIEAAMPGNVRQAAANNKASADGLRAPGDPKLALSQAQGNSKPGGVAAEINANKDKAFTAALEASVKEGARTGQFDTSLIKTNVQPDKSAALDGLVQSGAAPVVASQSGVAQAVINTPVAHEAWGDEFSQKITWMATQHDQTAELHLNPPNLGPLDVVLKVSGDQATALFTSPHAAVRDAVEQALPKLRDMMADNGIMLGNAMVSDQSPRDRQAWQAEPQPRGSGRVTGGVDAGTAVGAVSSGTVLPGRRHQGMVDTFV